VLTLCEARGLSARMLEWHYRSRDPSLIRVSNAEFYDDRLILPPSPTLGDAGYGLSFLRVPGVYSSKSRGGGRAGTNRIEAERIVDLVARHARGCPELSLGIVAFSKAQSDMLAEVLETARRKDGVLDAFLRQEGPEAPFVKNIENVQGDERDVILISVGYGPHEPDGRLASMNFGPVNGEGGERRRPADDGTLGADHLDRRGLEGESTGLKRLRSGPQTGRGGRSGRRRAGPGPRYSPGGRCGTHPASRTPAFRPSQGRKTFINQAFKMTVSDS
jgi:hypothetical protein